MINTLAKAMSDSTAITVRTVDGKEYHGTVVSVPRAIPHLPAHPAVSLDVPNAGGNVTVALSAISAILPQRRSAYED